MNITQALDHPELFAGLFDAASWRPWRVFLKALEAVPMDEAETALYRHHTGRTAPPTRPFRYGQLVCGRRGGKSRILAMIAVYLGCVLDHRPYVVPGEVPVIAIIAKDRQQAQVIKNYVVGFMREIPVFADMIETELAETVRLTNRVVIEVHTASLASPRGRTFLAVMCDELAFWRTTGDSANQDVEVINAVRPGLSTIPYSLLLIASSPYAKRGVLYTNYAKYFGKDDAPILVWQGTTTEMNATLIGDSQIEEMYLEDPDRAAAEFGAQFRSDIAAFITLEAIQDVIAKGVGELPPGGGISYSAFVDPSGGSNNGFTLAIGHLGADGTAVLDLIREIRPPFSPDSVVQEFATLLKAYGVERVYGDFYGGEWPRERFSAYGIAYEVSKLAKSALYSEFLPALNARRVRLLDNPRLIFQLTALERKTARGGKDSIAPEGDTPDDIANAAAGCLVRCIADQRPSLVTQAAMLDPAGEPLPLPKTCTCVVMFIALNKTGIVAVIYTALSDRVVYVNGSFAYPVFVLDFLCAPIWPTLFADVGQRAMELGEQTGARRDAYGQRAVFGYVDARLERQATVSGLTVEAIPKHLAGPLDELFLPASLHIAAGLVKICVPAHERARSSPFGGSMDLRGGDREDDSLRRAALWALAMMLDQ